MNNLKTSMNATMNATITNPAAAETASPSAAASLAEPHSAAASPARPEPAPGAQPGSGSAASASPNPAARFLAPGPTHKNNPFSQLTAAERAQLLRWCEESSYADVAARAALPRSEGGFGLATSEAALSRFYTRHHRTSAALEALGQFADHFDPDQADQPDRFLAALSTLLEMSLFKAMVEPDAEYLTHLRGISTALRLRRALEPGRELSQQISQQIARHDADVLARPARNQPAAPIPAADPSDTSSPSPAPAPSPMPAPSPAAPIVSIVGNPAASAPVKRTPGAPLNPGAAALPISPELLTRALSEIARLHPAEDRRSVYTPLQTELERALAHPHPGNSTNSTPVPKTPPASTYSTPNSGTATPAPFTNQPLRAAA